MADSGARKTEKDKRATMETRAPSRAMRLRATLALLMVVVIAFGGVILQLFGLQIRDGNTLQQEAVAQQLSDTITSPNRGTIYDSNQNVLAESQLVWTVIMSPASIADYAERADVSEDAARTKIADEVSALLDVDRDKLYEKTQKTYSQYEIVKKKIQRALVEELVTWVSENKMGGIFRVITDYKRVYPYGSLASTVLGFTGTDGNGLYGLEAQYESVLAGEAGRVITTKNGWGEQMPNTLSYEKTIDAEDGSSLVLTIDQTIQHYAEKYLEEAVSSTGCTNRGLAVVMNVKTGAILALAVKGDYDPNDPFTLTDPDVLAEIDALAGDEASTAMTAALQKQWTNKVVNDFYEPGSVFKVFTTSMGIEEGVADESSTFACNGALRVGDRNIRCHVSPASHGTQSFAKAISNSCNPAFMTLGLRVGSANFFKYFVGFGFTERTGIDMLGEAQVTSALYHGADMSEVSLATCSIGQTFKITPIQMITAISAVANGGRLMTPYVVAEQLDGDGNVVSATSPTVRRQVISEDTARRVGAMLAESVNGGGSKNAYVAGYRVAGKTGTADKTEGGGNVWASFSGFAPADDPEIAILVVLDEPHSAIRYGGTISAPVAQKILADTLPYLGIEPVYTAEEIAKMNSVTPTVVGKEISTATALIASQNLEYYVVGSGSTVLKQVPEGGTTIPQGGQVVLYTDDSGEDKTAIVPNFAGMTLTEANRAAASAGVNILITGLVTGATGNPTASTQSIPAGETISRATVVTVNFIYSDAIA